MCSYTCLSFRRRQAWRGLGTHPSCRVRWWPSPPWSPILSARAAIGGRGLQYIPRTPYLVDVIHALHLELSQPWHIQLPATIWAQSDLQLLLRLFPQQVPGVASETDITSPLPLWPLLTSHPIPSLESATAPILDHRAAGPSSSSSFSPVLRKGVTDFHRSPEDHQCLTG